MTPAGERAAESAASDIIECLQGHPDCPEPGHFEPAEDPERAASIATLRDLAAGYAQIADAIEAHDEIPAPHPDNITIHPVLMYVSDAEQLAAAARALPCKLAKNVTDKWLKLLGQFGGVQVQLYSGRELVCTRRVVGTEDREVEEVVTPAVTRTVTKPVEVVEWDCSPILAPGRSA